MEGGGTQRATLSENNPTQSYLSLFAGKMLFAAHVVLAAQGGGLLEHSENLPEYAPAVSPYLVLEIALQCNLSN